MYLTFPLLAAESSFIPSPNASSWTWTFNETFPSVLGLTNNVTWLFAGVVANAFPFSPTWIVGAIPSARTSCNVDLSDLTSVCFWLL